MKMTIELSVLFLSGVLYFCSPNILGRFISPLIRLFFWGVCKYKIAKWINEQIKLGKLDTNVKISVGWRELFIPKDDSYFIRVTITNNTSSAANTNIFIDFRQLGVESISINGLFSFLFQTTFHGLHISFGLTIEKYQGQKRNLSQRKMCDVKHSIEYLSNLKTVTISTQLRNFLHRLDSERKRKDWIDNAVTLLPKLLCTGLSISSSATKDQQGCHQSGYTQEQKSSKKNKVNLILSCQRILFETISSNTADAVDQSEILTLKISLNDFFLMMRERTTDKNIEYITRARRDGEVKMSDRSRSISSDDSISFRLPDLSGKIVFKVSRSQRQAGGHDYVSVNIDVNKSTETSLVDNRRHLNQIQLTLGVQSAIDVFISAFCIFRAIHYELFLCKDIMTSSQSIGHREKLSPISSSKAGESKLPLHIGALRIELGVLVRVENDYLYGGKNAKGLATFSPLPFSFIDLGSLISVSSSLGDYKNETFKPLSSSHVEDRVHMATTFQVDNFFIVMYKGSYKLKHSKRNSVHRNEIAVDLVRLNQVNLEYRTFERSGDETELEVQPNRLSPLLPTTCLYAEICDVVFYGNVSLINKVLKTLHEVKERIPKEISKRLSSTQKSQDYVSPIKTRKKQRAGALPLNLGIDFFINSINFYVLQEKILRDSNKIPISSHQSDEYSHGLTFSMSPFMSHFLITDLTASTVTYGEKYIGNMDVRVKSASIAFSSDTRVLPVSGRKQVSFFIVINDIHAMLNPVNDAQMMDCSKLTENVTINVSIENIGGYEWKGHSFDVNDNAVTTFLQELRYQHSLNKDQFLALLVSPDIRINLASNQTGSRAFEIDVTLGGSSMVWSPIFHLTMMSTIKNLHTCAKYLKETIYQQQHRALLKKKKKESPCVVLKLKGEQLNVSLTVGSTSHVAIDLEDLEVKVESGQPGLALKPNIYFSSLITRVLLNEFQQSFLTLGNISFHDRFAIASQEDIELYRNKLFNDEGTFVENCGDELITNAVGQPLKEFIGLHIENFIACVPPGLDVGAILNDLIFTPKALNTALTQMGIEAVTNKKMRNFQLMTINVAVEVLELSLLERASSFYEQRYNVSYTDPPMSTDSVFKDSKKHASCIELLKAFLKGIRVDVKRNNPPSHTQRCLKKLDEDPNPLITYGPQIQGGLLNAEIDHLVVILEPLNLATPLGIICGLKWQGLFFLTELSSQTPDISPGHDTNFSLGCPDFLDSRRSSSDFYNPNPCQYDVILYSRGIPSKVYIDGSLQIEHLSITFSNQVQDSIPFLLQVVKRIIPSPPQDSQSCTPLSWWDNLRFMIHGEIKIKLNAMCFRWLLDTIENDELSIELKCSILTFSYFFNNLQLSANEVLISLPAQPYPLADARQAHMRKITHTTCGSRKRHPLLLIPELRVGTELLWSVKYPKVTPCYMHHSPYMSIESKIRTSYGDLDRETLKDKFYSFRSNGLALKLKACLSGSDTYVNWLALRLDILPWITHNCTDALLKDSINTDDESPFGKIKRAENKEENDPFPKIKSILIDVCVRQFRLAIWHGVIDTSGICIKCPFFELDYEASTQSEKDQSKVEGDKMVKAFSIEVSGDVNAARLDVLHSNMKKDCRASLTGESIHPRTHNGNKSGLDYSNISKESNVMNDLANFDRFCGLFGGDEIQHEAKSGSYDSCKRGTQLNYRDSIARKEEDLFVMLQKWSNNISAVDYIVEASNIMITDESIARRKKHKSTNKFDSEMLNEKMSLNPNSKYNNDGALPPAGQKESHKNVKHSPDDEREKKTQLNKQKEGRAWSILVSGMKLLWTLEIRDVILTLIGDQLMQTVNFMVVQIKQNAPTNDNVHSLNIPSSASLDLKLDNFDSGSMNSLVGPDLHKARSLMHLLRQKSSSSMNTESSEEVDFNSSQNDSNTRETMPTVDIHLFNPQIQLHSNTTGGSIILAMTGAHVEGSNFIKFYKDTKSSHNNSFENLLRKSIFKYSLHSVEGFSIATDVDVKVGLQWLDLKPANKNDTLDEAEKTHSTTRSTLHDLILSHHLASFPVSKPGERKYDKTCTHLHRMLSTPMEFSVPPLFRKILDPFNFHTRQVIYQPPRDLTDNEIMDIFNSQSFEQSKVTIRDHIEFHIDELSFVLDAYQFSTTMDLIRKVLLAPLPVEVKKKSEIDSVRNGEQGSQRAQNAFDDDLAIKNMVRQLDRIRLDVDKDKKQRNAFRNVATDLANDIEMKSTSEGDTPIRCIKWNLSKAKWKISGEAYLDNVEIHFTELYGLHEFSSVGGVVSSIELEDFKAENFNPGPDSINFFDPTAVVTTELGDDRSPCLRCGAKFHQSQNEIGSCRFHADEYGNPGIFLKCANTGKKRWSCCNSPFESSAGCCFRPHCGRERAVTLRMEALPQAADNISIHKHVEVNIYPSNSHILNIQLTKSLADLFLGYFIGETRDDVSGLSTEKVPTHSVSASSLESNLIGANDEVNDASPAVSDKTNRKRILLFGGSKSKLNRTKTENSVSLHSDISSNDNRALPRDEADNTLMSEKKGGEIFYVQRWRMGHINVQISISGFAVDLSNFVISVPDFPRSYKVGSGPYLSKKYINFFIQEVIKSATSSGLRKIFSEEKSKEKESSKHDSESGDRNKSEDGKKSSCTKAKVNLLFGHKK